MSSSSERSTLSVYVTNSHTGFQEDLATRGTRNDAFKAMYAFLKRPPGGGKIWPEPETRGEGMLILTVQRDFDPAGRELNLGTTTLTATSLEDLDRFDETTWLSCQKRTYDGRVQAGTLPDHAPFREAVRSLSHPTSPIVKIDIWPSRGREGDEAIMRSLDRDDHMEGLVGSMLQDLLL